MPTRSCRQDGRTDFYWAPAGINLGPQAGDEVFGPRAHEDACFQRAGPLEQRQAQGVDSVVVRSPASQMRDERAPQPPQGLALGDEQGCTYLHVVPVEQADEAITEAVGMANVVGGPGTTHEDHVR